MDDFRPMRASTLGFSTARCRPARPILPARGPKARAESEQQLCRASCCRDLLHLCLVCVCAERAFSQKPGSLVLPRSL